MEAERCWWRDALDSLSRLHKAVGDSSQQSTTDTGAGAAAQVDPQLLRMAAGRLAVTIHLIQVTQTHTHTDTHARTHTGCMWTCSPEAL